MSAHQAGGEIKSGVMFFATEVSKMPRNLFSPREAVASRIHRLKIRERTLELPTYCAGFLGLVRCAAHFFLSLNPVQVPGLTEFLPAQTGMGTGRGCADKS